MKKVEIYADKQEGNPIRLIQAWDSQDKAIRVFELDLVEDKFIRSYLKNENKEN